MGQKLVWEVEYIDKDSGLINRFRVVDEDGDPRSILERAEAITAYVQAIGGKPSVAGQGAMWTGTNVRTPTEARALSEGQERMLITKLVRTDETRADLFGKGHKYPDLKLFELAELAEVGIDFEALEVGKEFPCRFFAIWQTGEKLNSKGNPYKNICWLESV